MDMIQNGSVITVAVPPDSMFFNKEVLVDGKVEYIGLTVDILHEIVRGTNISFRYIKGDGYSSPNGVLNLVRNGKADMAIGDISVTYERMLWVNFLFPFMEATHNFMLRQRRGNFDSDLLWMYTNPMNAAVWLVAVVTLIVLCSLWVCDKVRRRQSAGTCNWKKILDDTFTFIHLILRQSHPSLNNKKGFCGCVLVLSFFLSFMWTNSYLANFVAVATVQRENAIDTFEKLSLHRKYQLMVFNNTAAMELIKGSKNKIFQNIYKYQISASPQNFLSLDVTEEQVVKRVEQEYTALATTTDDMSRFLLTTCGMVVSDDVWLNILIGFPISKTFPFEEFFNQRIVKLRQYGIIKHLYGKYRTKLLAKKVTCNPPRRTYVSLQDTFSIFLWFNVGILLSFVTLMVEMCTNKVRNSLEAIAEVVTGSIAP